MLGGGGRNVKGERWCVSIGLGGEAQARVVPEKESRHRGQLSGE